MVFHVPACKNGFGKGSKGGNGGDPNDSSPFDNIHGKNGDKGGDGLILIVFLSYINSPCFTIAINKKIDIII